MILDQYGRPMAQQPRVVRARYDSAATTDDNKLHWAQADSLSAVSANSASVRKRLRERSRYETANNSYARGILNTLSAYTIGAGPTLQLTYRGDESEANPELRNAATTVEHLWSNWAYTRKLASKLATMQLAIDQDGEAFAMKTSSSRVSMHTPVQLDLRIYECDHFDSQSGSWISDDAGVRIDSNGEPVEYAFSAEHPGDSYAMTQSKWIPADDVIHLFRTERPGQLRGIPKTTPALPLFAQLRRFTLATLTAAETAADFSAILYGDGPADEQTATIPWERLQIERGAMLSVPDGMRMEQFRSEHPNAMYADFVKTILMEISRCLGVPAALARGTAEDSNYSSSRMDLQLFYRQMESERSTLIERDCLDRLLEAWLDEAILIDGFLPEIFSSHVADFEWAWRWPQPYSIDRKKDADGAAAELANHTTTLAREYAKHGLDWRTEIVQRASELEFMRGIGMTPAQSQPSQMQEGDGNG